MGSKRLKYDRIVNLTTQRNIAIELIRRGLRLSATKSLIQGNVSIQELSSFWHHYRTDPPRSGRLWSSVAAVLHTRQDKILMTALLKRYLDFADRPRLEIDVRALCFAFDDIRERFNWLTEKEMNRNNLNVLDINALWLAARDYVSGVAWLHFCRECHCDHIVCITWETDNARACPFHAMDLAS